MNQPNYDPRCRRKAFVVVALKLNAKGGGSGNLKRPSGAATHPTRYDQTVWGGATTNKESTSMGDAIDGTCCRDPPSFVSSAAAVSIVL